MLYVLLSLGFDSHCLVIQGVPTPLSLTQAPGDVYLSTSNAVRVLVRPGLESSHESTLSCTHYSQISLQNRGTSPSSRQQCMKLSVSHPYHALGSLIKVKFWGL